MPSEHRLHPASILFALSGSIKAFALPAIVVVLSSLRGAPAEQTGSPQSGPPEPGNGWTPDITDMENWQIWLLVFFGFACVSAVVRYLTFRLTYEGTELVIRSGLLFRNERHVPYDRIQNLDATRSVLHRALGVAEVRVETGGGQEPEARISVLREAEFDEMRRRVFEGRTRGSEGLPVPRADTGVPPALTPEPPAAHTLLHLPLRELLLLGLLDSRGFLLIVTAYGVLWESGFQGVIWDRLTSGLAMPGMVSTTWRDLLAGQVPSVALMGALLGGLVLVLAVLRVLSMVWVSVTLYDFRLARAGNDLRTEYGLLTRVTTTIPRGRIQSLTVRETPLERWCGRASIRVQTAGGVISSGQGSARSRERLAPIVRASDIPNLIQQVVPQANLAELEWQPLHPRAARRAVKPLLALIALSAVAVAGLRSWPAVLAYLAVGSVAAMLVTRRQMRRMAWASGEHVVAFRSGWLWRSVTIAPVVKIQTVTATESPFDRRMAMASVGIDTAGQSGLAHGVRIPFLARDTALELAARLSRQAAQTTFRW